MFSTIIDGEADTADVLFLVAVLLFAAGLIAALVRKTDTTLHNVLLFAGLIVFSLGWLVL